MIEFMHRVARGGIFAEMGLGKTGAVITFLADLFDRFEVGCVLVIAPLNVARWTWPSELALWDDAKDLTHEVLWQAKPGSNAPKPMGQIRLDYWTAKIDRLAREIEEDNNNLDTTPEEDAEHMQTRREYAQAKRVLKWGQCAATRHADIHIINRENAIWLVHFWGKHFPYDTVIYDESSDLKNGKKVLRWRAMRQVMGVTKRFIELTGTPAPKGLMDLWGQVYVLDGGARLGRTITQYRKEYFTLDDGGFVYEPRVDSMEKVTTAIKDICISLEARDFMDLPETIYSKIPVYLDDSEMKMYKTLKREYLLTLPNGAEIEAVTSASLSIKLLQLANGLVYDAERFIHRFHARKIDALRDYIAEQQGHNILVAYYFKHDLSALKLAFPNAVVFGSAPETIKNWNLGHISLMLIHPASAGHGINIQFGGRRILWFGPIPTRDLELYQQLNARLADARAVGLGTTFIDTLCSIGTIDEQAMEVLQMKAATQNAMKLALKGS